MHWYLKIPRFDGRKTLAFNGLVFIAASGWLTAAYTGFTGFGPVGEAGLHALAAVAALNGLLRTVTERPVWWRQLSWAQMPADVTVDMDDEGDDNGLQSFYLESSKTVYARAAEFVKRSDFTDIRESAAVQRDAQHYGTGIMQGGKHVPLADFQRDLDERLCERRATTDWTLPETELPLDEERERH
jgi:hypothetical protein